MNSGLVIAHPSQRATAPSLIPSATPAEPLGGYAQDALGLPIKLVEAVGRVVPAADGLIAAAAAIRHGLRLMTRDTSEFQDTGAMLNDPG